jgi:hypothetical protein
VDDFEKSFQKVLAVLEEKKWPGVEVSESWGTPSLKVKGKMLARIREPGVLVLMCNLEAKEMLLMVAPHIYFELPHYKGYPAILAHLDIIESDEIAEMIEEYWRKIAPKKMVADYDAAKTTDVQRTKSPVSKTKKPKAFKPKPRVRAKAKV